MRLAAILCLALLPLPALAEGARLTLDCAVMQSCTPEGACDPVAGLPAGFVIAPQSIDADGVGRYIVTRDDADTVALGLSAVGPFVWTAEDNGRVSLVLSSERTAILTRQPQDAQTAPTVEFLICEITL